MQRKPTEEANRLPILVSYAFLREKKSLCAPIMAAPDKELLLDSGAFTALNAGHEISLDEYIAFISQWQEHLFGYIALDKIRDPQQTETNLRAMLGAGLSPLPVHVLGDDERRMDELFEMSDWVALGGLRRPHRGHAPVTYLKQKMEWARGRKVHWLGYVRPAALRAFRPYSCDCSSFASGMMYGRIDIYAGRGRWYSFNYPEAVKSRVYLQSEFRRLLDYYEIEVSEFIDERQWHNGNHKHDLPSKDCVITRLPCRSWVRYVLEFKREFGVRIFIAAIPGNAPLVFDAHQWFLNKHNGGKNANSNLCDDTVRGIPSLAAGTARSGVSSLTPPAHLPCQGRENSPAR